MLIIRPKSSVRRMRAGDICFRAARVGARPSVASWHVVQYFPYTVSPEICAACTPVAAIAPDIASGNASIGVLNRVMISSSVGANYCTVYRADEAVALRLEELENGCGHRGRGFLRQIMPDDRNRPALIASGEKARLAGGRFRSVDAIAL